MHLTADHASAVLDEVMEGRASEVQTARLPDRAAGEGRDGGRAGRAGADDAPPRGARSRPGASDLVDTAGTGGGPSTLQHLDRRGAGRRRRGLRGRQARQPLEHQPLRLRRPARGARRRIELDPAGGRALHRGDRLRVHVRPAPPRGDEARRAGAQGARRADDLQLPRPADQPRRARAASCSASPTAATRRRSPRRSLGLGCERALVVSADDGLDELSVGGRPG